MKDICGIWHGENASAAITEDFSIVFLRLEPDLIASILNHSDYGTVGTVYGIGRNSEAHAVYHIKNPKNQKIFCNAQNDDRLIQHKKDKTEFDASTGNLIYTTYNGKRFELLPAEKIDDEFFKVNNKNGSFSSIAEKMAKWNIKTYFYLEDDYFYYGINTLKYSAVFNCGENENNFYCRIGQNGYCEKGYAMLSTTCIRNNESRMLENNLSALTDYKPDESCFVPDGCSFPDDGGWYWSIKEVTYDVIYLNGCGGSTYEICRN